MSSNPSDPGAVLSIAIDAFLNAPPSRVFEALVSPALFVRWMGPEGSRTTVNEMDAVPGGAFDVTIELPGGPHVGITGRYLDVERPDRLRHTWRVEGDVADTEVTFELHPHGDGTRLVLTHAGFTDESDRQQNDGGWRHQLDRLAVALDATAGSDAGLGRGGGAPQGGAHVRRAGPEDLDLLVELHRRFCAADDHEFDPARAKAAFAPLLADDRHGVVSVVDDPAGYGIVTWGWSIEAGGAEAVLDEIYVDEPGQGIGADLLEALVDACREHGMARIFLETETANERARRFYARHGFETDDSIWMSRDLG